MSAVSIPTRCITDAAALENCPPASDTLYALF